MKPWREGPLGRHPQLPARTIEVAAASAPAFVAILGEALGTAHFAPAEIPGGTAPGGAGEESVVAIFRRGTAIGDLLITQVAFANRITKIGPLSMRGVIVVTTKAGAAGRTRMTVSLIEGYELGVEFGAAVDAALERARGANIAVDDEGWSRATDLPESSPASPRGARAVGIR